MQQAQTMAALTSMHVRYAMLTLSKVKSARFRCSTRSHRRTAEMEQTLFFFFVYVSITRTRLCSWKGFLPQF